METLKAKIVRTEVNTTLSLSMAGADLNIPLTEDKPNDVKAVFNKLLLQLKNGAFRFELDDAKEDLYHHICKEYITQLNAELAGVYKELEDYNLLSPENKSRNHSSSESN